MIRPPPRSPLFPHTPLSLSLSPAASCWRSRNPGSLCTCSPPRSSTPSSPCSSLSCSTASADRPERSGARTRFAEHDATVRNISPRLDVHRPTALRDLVAWTRVSAGLGCREPNPGSLCFRSPLFLPCQKCGRPFSLERRVFTPPPPKTRQKTLKPQKKKLEGLLVTPPPPPEPLPV